MKALKKLLFGRGKSSSNLFMVMPVLAFVSMCCLNSGSGSRNEARTCLTANGANLFWSGSKVMNVGLSDGKMTPLEDAGYADVLCLENDEIVTIKEESVENNDKSRVRRTAAWRNSSKTYQLAEIEWFHKYLGVVQNRYFVSSARAFVEKSRPNGIGKGSRTEYYRVYEQPHIFNLDDSNGGGLKSHHLTREKLGLPESLAYDDLWIYPLKLDNNGSLLFAMRQKSDQSVVFYKINMFDGGVERTGSAVKMPPEMSALEQVVPDKSGKFAAFVYGGRDGDGSQKQVNVINLENYRTIASKNLRGFSLNAGTPRIVFEEKGAKLAILVQGFKFNPTRGVSDLTVFDLETGREIASIDAEELLQNPEWLAPIRIVGDDLLLTYAPTKTKARSEPAHLCKLNFQTKKVVWDKQLP